MNKFIKKHNEMVLDTAETKLHNKMVKSKKGWLKVAMGSVVMGAALITFNFSNQVSADEVQPTVTTSQVSGTNGSTNTSSNVNSNSATQLTLPLENNDTAEKYQSNNSQTQIDEDKQAIQNDQNQINDNNQKISEDQSQVLGQKQNIDNANNDLQNAEQNINAKSDAQTKSDATTITDLENKQVSETKSSIQSQIDETNSQKNDVNTQIASDQSKIDDINTQINSLKNQETNQSPVTVENNNSADGKSIVDTSKSWLENVSRDNLWGSLDQNHPNGNIIQQVPYVSPDNQKNDAVQEDDHTWGIRDFVNVTDYTPGFKDYQKIDPITNPDEGITDDQAREMSIAALNAINNARADKGFPPFTMSEEKFQQEQVRAHQPSAERMDHDPEESKTAFGGVYQNESLGLNSITGAPKSVTDLYNWAMYNINSMIDADALADWKHRDNFFDWSGYGKNIDAAFGFRLYSHVVNNVKWYTLVTTFDYNRLVRAGDDNLLDKINEYKAMGPITSQNVDNSAQIASLTSQVNQLQNDLTQNQNQLAQLQSKEQDLTNQMKNVKFDESKLSVNDQTTYNFAKQDINNVLVKKNTDIASVKSIRDSKVKDATNEINRLNDEISNLKSQNNELQKDIETKNSEIDKLESSITPSDDKPVTPVVPNEDNKPSSDKDTPVVPDDGNQTPATPSDDKPVTPVTPSEDNKPSSDKDTPVVPDDGNQTPATPSDDKPATPVTPSEDNKPSSDKDTPVIPDNGNQTPATPSDDKPATPVTPNEDNKPSSDKDTPVIPDNGNHTPVTPSDVKLVNPVISNDNSKLVNNNSHVTSVNSDDKPITSNDKDVKSVTKNEVNNEKPSTTTKESYAQNKLGNNEISDKNGNDVKVDNNSNVFTSSNNESNSNDVQLQSVDKNSSAQKENEETSKKDSLPNTGQEDVNSSTIGGLILTAISIISFGFLGLFKRQENK